MKEKHNNHTVHNADLRRGRVLQHHMGIKFCAKKKNLASNEYPKHMILNAPTKLLPASKGMTYNVDTAIPGYGDDGIERAEVTANNRHVAQLVR